MIFEILKQKQAMKIEYKNNYSQSNHKRETYIVSIPKSNNHDTHLVSNHQRHLTKKANIFVTSSKKNPKTKAKRHPSTKSKFPLWFGVFTAIVYNTKNSTVKNKFNKFWYRGTVHQHRSQIWEVAFNPLSIEMITELARREILIFSECESIVIVILNVIVSPP